MKPAIARILFVEDEENLLNSMSFILEREGFVVCGATSGEQALDRVAEFDPDLVLLDLNLPGMDGFEVAEAMAAACPGGCPAVIVITGREAEDDMIAGLERFADDYIIKPVQPRVLIARIQAVLRRLAAGHETPPAGTALIVVDSDAHEIALAGRPLRLTQTEFSILELLVQSPGKVRSRQQIINAIRGIDCFVTDRIVDFQICRLRKKLGQYGDRIETVRGFGYKYKPDGN